MEFFRQKNRTVPSEFRIGSGEELQNEIANKPRSGFVFSPNITIELSVFGGISFSVAFALFYLIKKRSRRR